MAATARGIYHNLKESEYIVGNGEIDLFFSSPVYCGKFLERYEEERRLLKQRIGDGFEGMNFDIISDIALYRRIEKRGQYAVVNGVGLGWRQLHQYALRKMTDLSINGWSKVRGLK